MLGGTRGAPVPMHLGWRSRIRLGRDYYVRPGTNDYSVDPSAIGRIAGVTADLGASPTFLSRTKHAPDLEPPYGIEP